MKEMVDEQALELWEKIKKRPEFNEIAFYLDFCCKFTEFHLHITTVTLKITCKEFGDLIEPYFDKIKSAFASELNCRVALQLQVLGEDPLPLDLPEASNQGVGTLYERYGLKFRSVSEMRLADVLQKRKVLYFPNAKGSLLRWVEEDKDSLLKSRYERVNKEPDFLVCYQGCWGILECDGDEYHDPSIDRTRDMLWEANGIRFIKRFSATDCYSNPEKVVADFLKSLKENSN